MTAAPRRRAPLAVLLAGVSMLLSLAFAPAASAAVEWDAEVAQGPTNYAPGSEKQQMRIVVSNRGGSESSEMPSVSFTLPDGVTLSAEQPAWVWTCAGAGTPQVVTCQNTFNSFPFPQAKMVKPYTYVGTPLFLPYQPLLINFDVAGDAPEGKFPLEVTMSGGGGEATQTHEMWIDSEQLPFGAKPGSFEAGPEDEADAPDTRAGGRPHEFRTFFHLNTRHSSVFQGGRFPSFTEGTLKDAVVDLPAGLVGNPTAVPRCPTIADVNTKTCPPSSQVGVAALSPPEVTQGRGRFMAIYNVTPDADAPALLAFRSPVGTILLQPVVRSDGDMGLSVQVRSAPEADPSLVWVEVRMWGVPADPSHDFSRCVRPNYLADGCSGLDEFGLGLPAGEVTPHAAGVPRTPFLSLPTSCDGQPLATRLHLSNWQTLGGFEADGDPDLASGLWDSETAESPPLEGCETLDFQPTLDARPTTDVADSPTGLDVDLHIPQNQDPDGLATAHLKDAVVTLPEGLVVNPSGANGLEACSPAQIGLTSPLGNGAPQFDKTTDACPAASKLGTVEVETPLLEAPMEGEIYAATPHQNPFGSLLSIYLVVKGPGILIKLAGEVTPDPNTGRLTTTFKQNPQLPFEDFHLDFFGGAAAALKTPATCGTKTTVSQLTPWSGTAAVTSNDAWAIAKGPGGAPCASSEAELPNAPAMQAGSTSPIAGAHSPFVVNLTRADGTQQLRTVKLTPPPGLLARLAGTTNCPDSSLAQAAKKDGREEQSSPSCPAASEVGTATAGAGAGPAPYYAAGKAYLAGPYKGAPLSLAIVTPAVAGPFDLGTIVVRTALHLDPRTAQITAASDPIPSILEGIPLNVRSVQIRLDRPRFTLNPTSCDPSAVAGEIGSVLGRVASLSERFQVGECGRLGFKPRLRLRLTGGAKRGDYQGVRATLTTRNGDANIARASVRMPRSAFLAQEHLNNVCTRVQFAADSCPKGSVYGKAAAVTPLMDEPLSGPVYLRSSDNTLPDLVAVLRGPAHRPIEVELSGRTDTVRKALRTTFDLVPDAPVTKFSLRLFGGKKGLIVNSTDLCGGSQRATVRMAAHNGRALSFRPKLANGCRKGRVGKRGRRGR